MTDLENTDAPVIEQVDFHSKRAAAIAKIKANVDAAAIEEEDQELENASEEEEKQLDEAVSTLDPIAQIKAQREQEKLERERLKELERQEERIKKLQREAAAGNERAQKQLEIEKKKQVSAAQQAIDAGTSAFKNVQEQAFNTAEKVRDTAGGFWDSIGRIAIPGSIWLPIAILLVFFFLLLPVNGYTRAQWLWLALVGNAKIESGGSGEGGGGQMSRQYTGVSVI